ncbi:PspC domain-containing protein [Leifsonia sp. NPDC080035]|uniref:PspC domain-containing protein n=1 Tax=Leifsonia sp. NPDC080035 TaxID=3143936 RepID=A0AAU7G5E6_9MICO
MSQNGSTPPPYGGPQTGFAGRGTRFFDWMRSIGVVRADGWLGGVCAGIAYRIGIDPLIVRGIAVVAAILGAPVLLLYAVAWALLPDREGRIHLQRLFDGDFEPPIVAIGVMLVLSLLPWTGGFWWFGGPFDHDFGWGDAVGRVIWTLIVLGAAAALIVLAVRNSGAKGGGNVSGAPGSPASPTSSGAPAASAASAAGAAGSDPATTTVPEPGAAAAAGVGAGTAAAGAVTPDAPVLDTAAEPTAPPAPSVGASPQDVADWRERQAQWRADHAQWKQRLDADMRAVKAQRSAEIRAQAAAATADADARRIAYRASNPRVGAAIGWLAVGVALVAGSLTAALWGPATGIQSYTFTAALAAATAVFGLTVLIAGLARRRSGFLIFLGMFLAVCTAISALAPSTVRFDRAGVVIGGALDVTPAAGASYAQGWGDTTIDLSRAVTAAGTPVVNLAKGRGETTILVPEDATIRLQAATPSAVTVLDSSGAAQTHSCHEDTGECDTDVTIGPAGSADAIVRVAQIDDLTIQQVQK